MKSSIFCWSPEGPLEVLDVRTFRGRSRDVPKTSRAGWELTKFHCLVAFNLGDIGQYVYCNCLLTRRRRHEFQNWPYLSSQAVFSA